MAQALFERQSIPSMRKLQPRRDPKNRLYRRSLHQNPSSSFWFLGLITIGSMGFWDWKLLLATLSGGGAMLLAYRMQRWNWQQFWLSIHRSLKKTQWQFTLAAGSGGIAALTAYLAAAAWSDSTSPWVGATVILQSCGTLTVLGLLLWQAIHRQSHHTEFTLDQDIRNLTETDVLKRLIAVRQLARSVSQRQLEPAQVSTVGECFRLMVSQETESVVKEALLDGLQALSDAESTFRSPRPIALGSQGSSLVKPRRRSLKAR